MKFRFGIEHEVAFLHSDGQFADFSNTPFATMESIVEELPLYEQDYPQLRVGDAKIKHKRWYVEGYERFDEEGIVWDCPPKGIEIRTTIHSHIDETIDQLTDSFSQLTQQARKSGLTPALVSFHPEKTSFNPEPPLNNFELRRRQTSPEMMTAHIPMLTQGPDLNLSVEGLSPEQIIDIGQKLTYYSPYIVPFSFSSPFYGGKLWRGLSARTFFRTGPRPAVMVFLADEESLINASPSLTQVARIPAEVGRIEFKSFDSCGDFALYGRLFTLLKGLVLDTDLSGRLTTPDAQKHQKAALLGFGHHEIFEGAQQVLAAARRAIELHSPEKKIAQVDLIRLDQLSQQLQQKSCQATKMIRDYQSGMPIYKILERSYSHRDQPLLFVGS